MAIGAVQNRTEMWVQRKAMVVRTLTALRVPVTPRTLAQVIQAWTGESVDARSVTTLCRQDRRAWQQNPDARRVSLVPALHHEGLSPIHAFITLSTWPIEDRIITPHSPRVDHTTLVQAVLELGNRAARRGDEIGPRLWGLAGRLATGIPGAVAYDGFGNSRRALRKAVTVEYGKFADLVTAQRASAAEQAAAIGDTDRLWGAPVADDDSP